MQRPQSYSPSSRRSLFLGIAAALAALANHAVAQQLEEIIVTAERRELPLQDTPISIMAFSGEKLEAKGIDDMFDLATFAPNLDIKGSRGTGNTSPTFQIRGIGGAAGATGERSVGFYVDNVFMPRTTGPVMRVLDVERIEILRGPQGTLFGRNSTGGAIRVFSKQAGPERDAYVRVRRGPQELGSNDDQIGRIQLGWHPSDDLTVNFGLMVTDSESDGSPTDMTQFNMAPVCPLTPGVTTYCLEGNYADWVSDFLQSAGQPRLSNNDPRLVGDD